MPHPPKSSPSSRPNTLPTARFSRFHVALTPSCPLAEAVWTSVPQQAWDTWKAGQGTMSGSLQLLSQGGPWARADCAPRGPSAAVRILWRKLTRCGRRHPFALLGKLRQSPLPWAPWRGSGGSIGPFVHHPGCCRGESGRWKNMCRGDTVWGAPAETAAAEVTHPRAGWGAEGCCGPGLELSERESEAGDAPRPTRGTVAKWTSARRENTQGPHIRWAPPTAHCVPVGCSKTKASLIQSPPGFGPQPLVLPLLSTPLQPCGTV